MNFYEKGFFWKFNRGSLLELLSLLTQPWQHWTWYEEYQPGICEIHHMEIPVLGIPHILSCIFFALPYFSPQPANRVMQRYWNRGIAFRLLQKVQINYFLYPVIPILYQHPYRLISPCFCSSNTILWLLFVIPNIGPSFTSFLSMSLTSLY